MDYSFKKDEMNGGDLIHNLRWLGNSGKLMKLVNVHEAPLSQLAVIRMNAMMTTTTMTLTKGMDKTITWLGVECLRDAFAEKGKGILLKRTGTFIVHCPKWIIP